MTIPYILDFSQSPLNESAGGHFHRVEVSDDPNCTRECLEEAIAHLIKQYGLAGETDTFVPKARVRAIPDTAFGFDMEVQIEPANLNQPTDEEFALALPTAGGVYRSPTDGSLSFSMAGVPFHLTLVNPTPRPATELPRYRLDVLDRMSGALQLSMTRCDWAGMVYEACRLEARSLRSRASKLRREYTNLEAVLAGCPSR